MPTDDLARFCCHNPDCRLYGLRGAGNLSGRSGHVRPGQVSRGIRDLLPALSVLTKSARV